MQIQDLPDTSAVLPTPVPENPRHYLSLSRFQQIAGLTNIDHIPTHGNRLQGRKMQAAGHAG